MRLSKGKLLLLAAAGVLACGDGPTAPGIALVGTWELVGFSEAGLEAAVTGTAEFQADRTFEINGTITFPEEPTESLIVTGTYEVLVDQVELTTPEGTGIWGLSLAGEQAVLTLVAVTPPNTITLRRLD
jgi:hypothetical protein